jgi:hypothetical protein
VIGAEGVAQAAALLLERDTPTRVATLALELGPVLDDADATPVTIYPHAVDSDEVPADAYPWLEVRIGQSSVLGVVERTDAGDTFRLRYDLEIFAWAIGAGYAQTQAIRNRLQLAVREVLLAAGTLPDVPSSIDVTSIREERAPTGFDESLESPVTAGRTRMSVTVDELLPIPPIGTVETVTVDTPRVAGPDDPLDDFGEAV